MAIGLSTAAQNAGVAPIAALADGADLQIRSGSRPASANDAATGTLLATVVLENPAYGSPTNGVVTLNVPSVVQGTATGTASWFRIVNGSTAFDGDVDTSASDLVVDTTTVTENEDVEILSGTLTMPAE